MVEQLRNTTAREQINASFSVLQVEITKKTGELREALHTRRFAPVRISPHTIQEAETVLAQADCLLGALPGDPLQAAPEVSKERLCRAVDTALMLDAALRALQSP